MMTEEMIKQVGLAQSASACSGKTIYAYTNGQEVRSCGYRNDDLRKQGYRICAVFYGGKKIH